MRDGSRMNRREFGVAAGSLLAAFAAGSACQAAQPVALAGMRFAAAVGG